MNRRIGFLLATLVVLIPTIMFLACSQSVTGPAPPVSANEETINAIYDLHGNFVLGWEDVADPSFKPTDPGPRPKPSSIIRIDGTAQVHVDSLDQGLVSQAQMKSLVAKLEAEGYILRKIKASDPAWVNVKPQGDPVTFNLNEIWKNKDFPAVSATIVSISGDVAHVTYRLKDILTLDAKSVSVSDLSRSLAGFTKQ